MFGKRKKEETKQIEEESREITESLKSNIGQMSEIFGAENPSKHSSQQLNAQRMKEKALREQKVLFEVL